MARTRNITQTNECALVDISAALAEVSTKFERKELDFDAAQEEISKIEEIYKQQNNKVTFRDLLINNNLYQYGFDYDQSTDKLVSQDQTNGFLSSTRQELFRYRDTAKNKIDAFFSHKVFDFVFVNRKRNNISGQVYISTKAEFNQGIALLKNDLCRQIVNDLDIDELKKIRFFTSSGPVIGEDQEYNYIKLMKHPKVLQFLSEAKIERILNNPISLSKDLMTFAALYSLNNFDSVLKNELKSLITIDPQREGLITNSNYVQETVGTSTEYWADDSHEAKNIKNYTSNMAKFIMRQIPRVQRVAGKFVPYEGQYLNANDLYVLGYILKQAEYEYNLMHMGETNFNPIILQENTVENSRFLLSQSKLPAIKGAKQDLISSIQSFLYEGDVSNKPIATLFKEQFPSNNKILDIESLLMFEANQSYAPTYTEFSEDLIPEYKNYGGVYAAGSSLKWNITEFLYKELNSKKKSITKEFYDKKPTLNPGDKIFELIVFNILGLDALTYEANSDFIQKHKNAINKMAEILAQELYNPKELKQAKLSLKNNESLVVYKECEVAASNIIANKLKAFREFKHAFYTLMSDRVLTQFDNNADATIPTYRLNSAITMDSWFMQQYRNTQYGTGQNFLVDNPLLFSKWVTKKLDEDNGEMNENYKDSTSYLLDVGDTTNNSDINELSPSDQLVILTLNNILGIEKDLFHFQPVCYSDKSSIGVKTLNLQAKVKFGGKITSLKELLSLYRLKSQDTVNAIRLVDYQYRKNNTLQLINSILKKWNDILYDGEESEISPLKDLGFAYQSMRSSTYQDSGKLFSVLKDKINELNTLLKSYNSTTLQEKIKIAQQKGLELIDELDYVKFNGSYEFNQSLLYDFENLETFDKFNLAQEASFQKALESQEYKDVVQTLIEKLKTSDQEDLLFKTLIRPSNNDTFKYFTREYDKKKKEYKVELVKNSKGDPVFFEAMRVFTALSNLGRYAYLDLVSKFEYLDPSKKKTEVNPYVERAKRIDAMAKRMVLYPATIQAYCQGKIDGVTLEPKVAVIEDPKEKTWNISGDDHSQDIYDGSGFISPFWSIMENNSLPGHGIDGTKKTLGTSTRGNNSTLFKWAEFPITNEKMRWSIGNKFSLIQLFKKMHSNPQFDWTNLDIDITKSFTGKSLSNPGSLISSPIYIHDGFEYKKIVRIIKTGFNEYQIDYDKVDERGRFLEKGASKTGVKIDSIYSLWEALGGIHSASLSDSGKIELSEASIDATFQYIINVGTSDDSGIYNQKHVNQPLRNRFIAIAANKSAVKRGATNINTSKSAWESDSDLSYFTINTACFGIQLDANHHSDMADVREMSQTISALAALGRTTHLAEQAYTSIADLVRISLKKVEKYLKLTEKQSIDSAINELSRQLINSLSREKKSASLESFIEMFSDKANTTILPISDRRFYKLFIKQILGDLNKSSIRRRYTGLGGILNPASNIMQMYEINGKNYLYSDLLREAKDKLPQEDKQALINLWQQREQNNQFVSPDAKDRAIVDLYLKEQILGSTVGRNAFLNQIPGAFKQVKTAKDLRDVKILCTVSYIKPGETDRTEKTLDTLEEFDAFWKLVEDNWDPITGTTKLDAQILMHKPHDLRPQYVSWETVHPVENGESENRKIHNIYTTKGARLSKAVGSVKYAQDEINKMLADLSEQGQDIKASCKV